MFGKLKKHYRRLKTDPFYRIAERRYYAKLATIQDPAERERLLKKARRSQDQVAKDCKILGIEC